MKTHIYCRFLLFTFLLARCWGAFVPQLSAGEINGGNVEKVTYKVRGQEQSLLHNGQTEWTDQTNTYTEQARDEWSVYLVRGQGKREELVHVDLYTKKVTLKDARGEKSFDLIWAMSKDDTWSAAKAGAPAPAFPPAVKEVRDSSVLRGDDPRVQEFLALHNAERSAVGVPPLKWSDELARDAHEWARKMSGLGRIYHGEERGENVSTGKKGWTLAKAVKLWLAEKEKFSKGNMEYYTLSAFPETGQMRLDYSASSRYAQMVWRATQEVGVALVEDQDGRVSIVARYRPAGIENGQPAY